VVYRSKLSTRDRVLLVGAVVVVFVIFVIAAR
jgi:hypothetical protein